MGSQLLPLCIKIYKTLVNIDAVPFNFIIMNLKKGISRLTR